MRQFVVVFVFCTNLLGYEPSDWCKVSFVRLAGASAEYGPDQGQSLLKDAISAGSVIRFGELTDKGRALPQVRDDLKNYQRRLLVRLLNSKTMVKIEVLDPSQLVVDNSGPYPAFRPKTRILKGRISDLLNIARIMPDQTGQYLRNSQLQLNNEPNPIRLDDVVAIKLLVTLPPAKSRLLLPQRAKPNFVDDGLAGKTTYDHQQAINASQLQSKIPMLKARSAGVVSVYDLMGKKLGKGYLLGQSDFVYDTVRKRFSGLKHWQKAYEEFAISQRTKDENFTSTNHELFLEKVTSSGKPVVFLIPGNALTYKTDSATLREINWLLSNPDKLKNVTFVFGSEHFDEHFRPPDRKSPESLLDRIAEPSKRSKGVTSP